LPVSVSLYVCALRIPPRTCACWTGRLGVAKERCVPLLCDTHTHSLTHTHIHPYTQTARWPSWWCMRVCVPKRDCPHVVGSKSAVVSSACVSIPHTPLGRGGASDRDTHTHTHTHRVTSGHVALFMCGAAATEMRRDIVCMYALSIRTICWTVFEKKRSGKFRGKKTERKTHTDTQTHTKSKGLALVDSLSSLFFRFFLFFGIV
jgi:hypothetical protein